MTFRAALVLAFASLSMVAGCKPHFVDPNAKPELQVGTGDGEFEPVGPKVPVPVNYGPQGGEHIWFAARCRGVAADPVLTYSIVDDQGNVVSAEQSIVISDDDIDDQGFYVISSLTAFIDDTVSIPAGTHLVFHGHLEDTAGHVLDASAEAILADAADGF
ncbi:MAG: hypothetical protein QM820_46535 [Minicystis sp.]